MTKIRWLFSLDLYPWLFALSPLTSLVNENLDALRLRDALRPAVLISGLTLLGLLAGRKVLGSWDKASILWAAAVTLSYSIGLVARAASGGLSAPALPTFYGVVFLAWLMALLLLGVAIRTTSAVPAALTAALNLAGIVALALPITQMLTKEVRMEVVRRQVVGELEIPAAPAPPAGAAAAPDIYYIILDGYGRQDVLSEMYDLPNQDFYRGLEARGFTIAEASHANYVQTSLSFASALNMTQLTFLADKALRDPSQWTVAAMIRENLVVAILHEQGYSTAAFTVGYRRAEMSTADLVMDRAHPHATPLEALMLETSTLAGWMYLPTAWGGAAWLPGYADYRDGVTWTFSEAARLAPLPGPKFIFVHVLAPHPPFVFGPYGESVRQEYPYRLGDGSDFRGTDQESIDGYRDQVRHINDQVLMLVDALQGAASTPPVIVVQGDHGPGSELSWDDAAATNMWERLSILNAYAVPGLPKDAIDPGISPVNTFRMILEHLFGYPLPRVLDESYYSTWRHPYDFTKVTFTPDNQWTLDPVP